VASRLRAKSRPGRTVTVRVRFADLRSITRSMTLDAPFASTVTLAEIADVCYVLGQACSSSALIYAMHQIKMACIVRHYKGNPAHEKILRRIAAEQLLMASSTTEGQAGGNVRSSEAAVEHDGAQITLERKATVISYAVEADGIVTTARRAPDAQGNDQVLLVLLKSDYTLERLQVWDTLGMRGTHSEGFTLRARAAAGKESRASRRVRAEGLKATGCRGTCPRPASENPPEF